MVLKFFSVLNSIKNCNYFVPNSSKITRNGLFNAAAFCTEVTVQASPLAFKRQKISKAMKAYLQRSKEHNDFIKTQQLEYQIGKRHLANMMGEDPETFTQKDIDNAIEYLFPSGLYDKRARPAMKSPEEVFPARKAAEFDETGRPFHSMFYTGRANFFKLLYDIVEEMKNLNDLEDRMIRNGLKPDESQKIDLTGFQWTPKEELEKLLVETIADIEYTNFTNAMSRLVELPYSYKRKEFIGKFMKPLIDKSKQIEIPKTEIDENGRQFVTTYECLRKKARGDVTIRSPGTGQMQINGRDITYFEHLQSREQLIFPLIFADMLGKVDVEAHVEGGGPSGQAGALRWGIAMCLRSFVDAEMVEKMRLAGLLTRDYRRRERKKFGQEGARRKYTWKKR